MDPGRGSVLAKLQDLSSQKAAVLGEDQLDEDTKAERVNSLQVKNFWDAMDGLNMLPCRQLDGADIEDLAMTMEYSPSSKVIPWLTNHSRDSLLQVYGYQAVELRLGGGEEAVTVHNMEEYVERTVDWALYRYDRRLGM